MRKPVVIDTNVIVTANSGTVSCKAACARRIKAVQATGRIVMDFGGEIRQEYQRNVDRRTSGAGTQFLTWLLQNAGRSDLCQRVDITKEDDEWGYGEFPRHPALTAFDASDRKFVAVAAGHPDTPPILQASDSKWWGWKDALAEVGVTVDFLCPAEIASTFERKMKQ